MINLWSNMYKKYKHVTPWDQPSLRAALWNSDINLFILPVEYNRRAKATKDKCIRCRKEGDKRFPKTILKLEFFIFMDYKK